MNMEQTEDILSSAVSYGISVTEKNNDGCEK